ncbi:hypothetical protein C0583_00405 [Candidatus Parcubacteria bacterium]|nr:MAG: hypothetical protein C0583_00405 [Candidatus Parcubacteria bacterium]
MNYIDVTICQLFALLLFVHLFFLIGTRKKRNDIADVAWGLGFVLLAVVGTIHNPNTKTIIVLVLLMFWGFRLARHIFNRFRSHKEEDMRYQEFRKAWGSRQVLGAYFKVYLLQGFSLILVAMPILVLARFSDNSFSFINMIGVALWLFGFVFEVVADKQLKDFVKDKKPGQIMKNGLWSY